MLGAPVARQKHGIHTSRRPRNNPPSRLDSLCPMEVLCLAAIFRAKRSPSAPDGRRALWTRPGALHPAQRADKRCRHRGASIRLHGRLTSLLLRDGVACALVQVHVSGEHNDWRSRLRSATARSRRFLLQGQQRCLRDPFSCLNLYFVVSRRAEERRRCPVFPAPVSSRRLDTWPEGLFTRRLLVTVCASLEPVSDASVHWFDSLLRFLTSLHGFGSLIRFIVFAQRL